MIGFAGTNDKVKWLEDELGFDRAFNYKVCDLKSSLKEAAPNGVDCYFDNVRSFIRCLKREHQQEFIFMLDFMINCLFYFENFRLEGH